MLQDRRRGTAKLWVGLLLAFAVHIVYFSYWAGALNRAVEDTSTRLTRIERVLDTIITQPREAQRP